MFTKSMHATPDMDTQRMILDRVSHVVDQGVLRCTLGEDGGTLSAEALARAHRLQTTGTMIGKLAFRVSHG
jgi:NADPH2:quinone reductase